MSRWCRDAHIERGATISVRNAWRLGKAWYADRLRDDWSPKSPEVMEGIFSELDLRGDFWRVR